MAISDFGPYRVLVTLSRVAALSSARRFQGVRTGHHAENSVPAGADTGPNNDYQRKLAAPKGTNLPFVFRSLDGGGGSCSESGLSPMRSL
jgi:hypothetical protein